MEEYIEHEKFVIRTFQESMRGLVLIWFASLRAEDISTWEELANWFVQQYRYNLDTAPSRTDLHNMEMSKG